MDEAYEKMLKYVVLETTMQCFCLSNGNQNFKMATTTIKIANFY